MSARAEESLASAPAPSRAFRWFPELASARALAAELRENPYWARWHLRGAGDSLRRGAALSGLAALAAFAFARFLSEQFQPLTAAGFILVCAIPARLYLVARASSRAAGLARREMESDAFVHLLMTPMRPRDYVLAWAGSAWVRTVPETLVIYAALAPFAMAAGLGLAELLAVEAAQAMMLTGLASALAARGALDWPHRRDAAWSGWIMASVSYPLVFFAQSLVFLPFVAALPFALGLLAGGGGSSVSFPADASDFLALAGPAIWLAYALWFPFAWAQALARQIGGGAPSSESLREYLSEPPRGDRQI